ncbi:MAG: hypothetical protein K0R38_1887 [Polyangiaceae bacterium]|jgi:hypothetical protein|nr:hypothetical protein [Polyangiaceae bacterium]
MNTKHTVNAPAVSGHRSMLRRFVTVATMGALMLGVASASADKGREGKGRYSVTTIAGVGDNYTGKLDVKGEGKFKVEDKGDALVFISHIGGGKDLNMKDGRQKHTCGDDKGEGSKLPGLKGDSKVRIVIQKSALTFPEGGKEASGTAPGKLKFLDKESTVNVKYTVKEDGGKYTIKNASFDFDYTKHMADGKKVCLMLVCVRPTVTININDGVVEK